MISPADTNDFDVWSNTALTVVDTESNKQRQRKDQKEALEVKLPGTAKAKITQKGLDEAQTGRSGAAGASPETA